MHRVFILRFLFYELNVYMYIVCSFLSFYLLLKTVYKSQPSHERVFVINALHSVKVYWILNTICLVNVIFIYFCVARLLTPAKKKEQKI